MINTGQLAKIGSRDAAVVAVVLCCAVLCYKEGFALSLPYRPKNDSTGQRAFSLIPHTVHFSNVISV